MYEDTIAAIATAPGEAGIGVVRLSGPQSAAIGRRMFRPSSPQRVFRSHHLYHGTVVDGEAVLDEVLFACMRAPHSYTAEDVVEFQGHGGTRPLEGILRLALRHGARLAGPGEFTLRAFLNGRLDLAQAEAVADVIRARSDASLRLAVNQLAGRLSGAVHEARGRVLGLLAQLQANIDFSEDDVPSPASEPLRREMCAARASLTHLLRAADAGILYRQGARVAIAGRPNAGKSSLLNALLRTNRAIVTPVAGTTRDTIEEGISLDGLPLVLVDTAGITQTVDVVEAIGVARSREAIASANLVLHIFDAAAGWQPEDAALWAEVPVATPKLLVANKSDLPLSPAACAAPVPIEEAQPVLRTSAITGQGLAELEAAMRCTLLASAATAVDDILVNNLRHKQLLEAALRHLADAEQALTGSLPADFICIDLRAALSALGAITGEDVTEGLLDEIFGRFCIGK
ncbi:MAG: tRNA uridine-5-carboxymethylaminomethyl(34) synthesis GTPase MnmE [Chloroflexota bacterium]